MPRKKKQTELFVLNSCDGCGACCLEQSSPPGYLMMLKNPEEFGIDRDDEDNVWADDLKRVQALPAEAVAELEAYGQKIIEGTAGRGGERPCIWLDIRTRRCRYHEHRPSVCRDFEVGSDSCHAWREQYAISR